MNFYHQLNKKSISSRKYCGCHLHIHQRGWIHAPCLTTEYLKNYSSTQNEALRFNMEQTSSEDSGEKDLKKILDEEISVLEAAKNKLEEGGVLSDHSKEVIIKWKKPEKSTYKQKKKSKSKQKEVSSKEIAEALPDNSRVNEIQNGFAKLQESKKGRSRIRDYQTENRKLREKVKELSKNVGKNINGSPLVAEQPSALLKLKYDNLVTYVLKVEAENQQLKKAINPNDSESATESVLDPFKLKIRHLERKILDQEDTIKQYQNMRHLEEKNDLEEDLFIKLTTTRDIYETAIQGYKDQIKHLMIECSHLKILNGDLTRLKSTAGSESIDVISDPGPSCDRGVVRNLELLVDEVASKADRESILASLRSIIAGLRPESQFTTDVIKADAEYKELEEKYVAAMRTIEELSEKIEHASDKRKEIQSPLPEKSEIENKKELISSPEDENHLLAESDIYIKDADKSSELNQSLNEHIITLKENNRVLQEHVWYLEERLAVLLKEMKRKDEILDRVSGQLDSKIRDRFSRRGLENDIESEEKSAHINELRAENERLSGNLAKIKGEKVHLEKSFRNHAYSLEEQVDQLSLKNAKFQKQLDTIINMYKETFASGDDLSTFSWIHDFMDKKK